MSKSNVKNDRKTFVKWLLLLIATTMIGAMGGTYATRNTEQIDAFLQIMINSKELVVIPFVSFFFLSTIVGYGYIWAKYKTAKRLVEAGYDDEAYDKAERYLSRASVATNIVFGINYMLLGICLYLAGIGSSELTKKQGVMCLITLGIFIVASICNIVMFNKTVKLNKIMNPEKKGNIFDRKFAKEWIGSCDEAEKALIYESAYKAYRVAINLATGLWAMSIIGMMSFHTGVFAVVVSSIMLIALVSSYSITAYKLQYKK